MKRYNTHLSEFLPYLIKLISPERFMKTLLVFALAGVSLGLQAQVSGRVFRDYNANGTQNTVPPNV